MPYVIIRPSRNLEALDGKSIMALLMGVVRAERFCEEGLSDDTSITHQTVEYGGFTFRIPAICFDSMLE